MKKEEEKVICPENPIMKKNSLKIEPVCLSVEEFKILFELDEVNLKKGTNIWVFPLWGSVGLIGM